MASKKSQRILWLLNHKTLMPFEVPLLQSFGFEVFTPKIIPTNVKVFRSGAVDYSYDKELTIPDYVLEKLNAFDFYADQPWPGDIVGYLNRYFDAAVIYPLKNPFQGILSGFSGKVILRAFGLDNTMTYDRTLNWFFDDKLGPWLERAKDRFWFGQGYEQLAECEGPYLADRALFLPLGLPDYIWDLKDTWHGTDKQVLFVCPNINDNGYYARVYQDFKEQFGDLPHVIVGQQGTPVDDPHVLPNVTDEEMYELYQQSAVMYYHSHELRHVHYAPAEAAIVGTPVVFYRNSLLGRTATGPTMGGVDNLAEARRLVERLLESDPRAVWGVKEHQDRITYHFTWDYCRDVFRRNLLNGRILSPPRRLFSGTPRLEMTSQAFEEIHWTDSMVLDDGRVTSGAAPVEVFQNRANVMLDGVSLGDTVFDYGDGDGFFAFEAEARGAARTVCAILGDKDAFLYARENMESSVELFDAEAPKWFGPFKSSGPSGNSVETFDVVMVRGALNHTRNPMTLLEQLASRARKQLIIETVLDLQETERPVMVYYGDEQRPGYPTDGFGFNPAFFKSTLLHLGFREVNVVPTPDAPGIRGIVKAYR